MKLFMDITKKMHSFFITGTDTGVGKTLTAAAITLALKAYYWKPIQSGVSDEISDCERIQMLTQLTSTHFYPSRYVLQASLAPDQAAKRERVKISLSNCQKPITENSLIVEGAGGVFVPLNEKHCMLDLMQQLSLPVIIVSRGLLGTINHTLLTIEALRQHQLKIKGVIFSGKLHTDNKEAIEKWGKVNTLFHLPYFEQLTKETFQFWVAENHQKIVESLK